jgi:hypothetical protein
MQQEALAIIFISWIRWSCISKLGDLSHKDLTAHTLIVHTIFNSLCCYYPAQHLISKTPSSPQSGAIFYQLDWFSIAVFLQVLILELIFNSFCFESLFVMFFSFLFLGVQDILWRTQFSRAVQGLISGWSEKWWHDANIAKHDSCRCRATISAMVGISGVWWCNGDSKTHGFIDYAQPDCLWPLPKAM